jgi:DNA-directed RNA polymerase subunit RPC12/RpoP
MFSTRLLALLAALLLLPSALAAQPKYTADVYHDFRGKAPMPPQLRLGGPDLDAVTKSEAAGLRVSYSKERKTDQNVVVATTFDVVGDFEITGTYELLSADMPNDGWGVGVSINVADNDGLQKFLKIGRFMRPKTGSVYMAEYWTKGADDWRGPTAPTDVFKGQLRIVREGLGVRCQVADGDAKEFMTIFAKADFGSVDLSHLRFMVTAGSKAGYAVDARLVDLRIRHSPGAPRLVEFPGARVAIAPEPGEAQAGSRGLLALSLLLGFGIMLLIAIALGMFFYLRPRGVAMQPAESRAEPISAEAAAFVCSACGKNLKFKPELRGKNVKCPKCGQAVLVPRRDEAEA